MFLPLLVHPLLIRMEINLLTNLELNSLSDSSPTAKRSAPLCMHLPVLSTVWMATCTSGLQKCDDRHVAMHDYLPQREYRTHLYMDYFLYAARMFIAMQVSAITVETGKES